MERKTEASNRPRVACRIVKVGFELVPKDLQQPSSGAVLSAVLVYPGPIVGHQQRNPINVFREIEADASLSATLERVFYGIGYQFIHDQANGNSLVYVDVHRVARIFKLYASCLEPECIVEVRHEIPNVGSQGDFPEIG